MLSGGYFYIMNSFIEDPRVTKNHIAVYAALCRYARVGTDECFVSQGKVAEMTGVHRTTVNEILKELVELGYVTSDIRQRSDGGRSTNLYKIVNIEQVSVVVAEPTDDVVDETPLLSQTTGPCGPTLHHNNNNTFNNKNSILSKDSIKSDSVTSPRQSTLFTLTKKKDPLLELSFMEKKVLDEYIKGIRGRERSTLKLKLAELGKCSWEELSDTDFVYYYVDQHNMVMSKPLAVTDRPGFDAGKIKSFRTTYNISKSELYSIIPKMLLLYKDMPECDSCLNFGTLSNAHFLAGPLVERVRQRETSEFKVESNKFNFTKEQLANAPEVF